MLKVRGRQRTGSTYVLAAVHDHSLLEPVAGTLRAALDDLAAIAPDCLRAMARPVWCGPYGRRIEEHRLPRGQDTTTRQNPRVMFRRSDTSRLIRRQHPVFIRIQGESRYLWRAVDQNGVVLDIPVQSRRDGAAAKRFFRRLLKSLRYGPRVLVTDKLKSYGMTEREVLPDVEHRESRYLNNRARNSHRPSRRRERQMQRFKSMRQAQRFLSAQAFTSGHFRPRRHRMTTSLYRAKRAKAFKTWTQKMCARSVR